MDNNECHQCGAYVPMTRYEKAKLCMSCREDKRAGNSELRQLFKELQKKNLRKYQDEDWSHLNVKCNDRQIWKY